MSAPVDVRASIELAAQQLDADSSNLGHGDSQVANELREAGVALDDLIDAVQRVDEVLVDRKGHEFLEAYAFTFNNLQRALARVRGGA